MKEPHPSHLPWLDRLTTRVPGYGGYQSRAQRRSAAFALRDALDRRLSALKTQIRQAIHSCLHREATTEIAALERIDLHIDRVQERVRGLGSRLNEFYDAPDLHPTEVDPLHAIDHDVLEHAEELAHAFEKPDLDHNRLAEIEAGLNLVERKLDDRALLMRSIED
jgi:hypothetical protein